MKRDLLRNVSRELELWMAQLLVTLAFCDKEWHQSLCITAEALGTKPMAGNCLDSSIVFLVYVICYKVGLRTLAQVQQIT